MLKEKKHSNIRKHLNNNNSYIQKEENRIDLYDEVLSFLDPREIDQIIIILGDSGQGKSSFLYYLKNEIR